MYDIDLTKLPNDLRVYTVPMRDTQAMSCIALCGVGSRNEENLEGGISHLLEHMVFKGTKRYPTTKVISEKLDGVGAEYNAFTSEEATGYWVHAAAAHAPLAVDILSELVLNPKLSGTELAREKNVVLEEIKMYHDMPQSHVQDLNQALIFSPSTLGRPVIGTPESVQAATAEALKGWHARWYQPRDMVLVLAGNPLQYDWLTMIEKRFRALKPRDVDPYPYGEFAHAGPQISGQERATDQAHLVLSFRTLSYHDQRKYILWTLANLLGGMMSSRLFLEVREKRGLAYYVNAGTQEFSDTGALTIRAGVDPKNAIDTLQIIRKELSKLMRTPPPVGELQRAKENLKGELVLRLEDSMAIARFVAQQALQLGTVRTPSEITEDIDSVTGAEVRDAAAEFFAPENSYVSYVGPLKSEAALLKAVSE